MVDLVVRTERPSKRLGPVFGRSRHSKVSGFQCWCHRKVDLEDYIVASMTF